MKKTKNVTCAVHDDSSGAERRACPCHERLHKHGGARGLGKPCDTAAARTAAQAGSVESWVVERSTAAGVIARAGLVLAACACMVADGYRSGLEPPGSAYGSSRRPGGYGEQVP